MDRLCWQDLWDGYAVLTGVAGLIGCVGRSCVMDRLCWQELCDG